MLCLSRNLGQEILVWHAGECLRIVIAGLKSSAVRLDFDGPVSFEILRDNAKRQRPRDPQGRGSKPKRQPTTTPQEPDIGI